MPVPLPFSSSEDNNGVITIMMAKNKYFHLFVPLGEKYIVNILPAILCDTDNSTIVSAT